MQQTGWQRVKASIVAGIAALALCGCTIPIINIEVPIELPNIKLPNIDLPAIDLSKVDIKPITLPIGVQTSVKEARQASLSGKAATLGNDALVTPGYLTVGLKTVTSTAPTCVEGEGGRVYGLDVDLGAALASEMGLKVRYVKVADGSSLGTQCDVVMNGRSSSPEKLTVAGTYVESATSLFHRGEPTVTTSLELNGSSVGLQGGSASELVLNKSNLKMSQKGYVNLNAAFDALDFGEVEYVLCEAYPGAYLASLHEGVSFAGTLEPPETSGVVVLTSNAQLVSAVQTAFNAISSNGILEVVRSRWVGNMPILTTDAQVQGVTISDAPATSATTGEAGGDGSEAGSNAITSV